MVERIQKSTEYKINFQKIAWKHPLPGARYKAFSENGQQIRLVEFTGKLVEPDWCRKGHIGYVLSGEMEIDFNGTTVTYQKGDGIFIPPGEEHKHMVTAVQELVQLILIEQT